MKSQLFASPTARRFGVALGLIGLTASLTACGTIGDNAGASNSAGGTIRIAYIQKQGDQQYFIDQADGAKAMATELGAEVTEINVGDDANAAISQLDTVISQGYDAIAIVVPDQKIGPQVIAAAKAAGIPLVATDDAILDADGNAAPFVGFDGTSMGQKVGEKAAELFSKTDWTAANTKIIRVSKEDLATCEQRVEGALDVFTKNTGVNLDVIKVGTDASVVDSQDKTAAAITANPGVKHWVVWGCNDESETGAVTALQNAGVAPADIIGVGLGAYLTCKDWAAGVDSGNKAALYISGVDVGKAAVKVLVDKVKNGVALPANTIADTSIVDDSTYKAAGVVCT
jgi:L-arabinose transport system substrate-binding protein